MTNSFFTELLLPIPTQGYDMREPDYRGLAALVLATALGLMLVIGVGAPSLSGQPLGEVGSQALTAIGGAIVGLLAGFIAGTITRPPDKGE